MKIYSDTMPTYIFNFDDENKYNKFKDILNKNLAAYKISDLDKKIKYDDDTWTVNIYYFPRIFRGFFYTLIMDRCARAGLVSNAQQGNYTTLDRYLNPNYVEQHNLEFQKTQGQGYKLDTEVPQNPHRLENLDIESKTAANHTEYSQLIRKLLSKSFVIGEKHEEPTVNKFLRENIPLFAKNGIKTLFLEDVFYELQFLLDEYLNSKEEELPGELELALRCNDETSFHASQVLDIVKTAKIHGIRIVGLETQNSHKLQVGDAMIPYRFERIRAFNYQALQIIRKEMTAIPGGKFIIRTGAEHLLEGGDTTPGLAKLLDCPGIVFADGTDEKEDQYRIAFHGNLSKDEQKRKSLFYGVLYDVIIKTNWRTTLKADEMPTQDLSSQPPNLTM